MRKPEDITGKKFGRLFVMQTTREVTTSRGWKLAYWKCKCSCGKYKEVRVDMLRNGKVTSCGCYRREKMKLVRKFKYSNIRRKTVRTKCTQCGAIVIRFSSGIKSKRIYCTPGCYHMSTKGSPFIPYLNLIRNNNNWRRRKKLVKLSVNDLSAQWQKQNGICPYTGHKLILLDGKKHEKTPMQASLDRIDNSKDYVKGNIQFVALMANYAKNEFSSEELIKFCRAVSNYCPSDSGS